MKGGVSVVAIHRVAGQRGVLPPPRGTDTSRIANLRESAPQTTGRWRRRPAPLGPSMAGRLDESLMRTSVMRVHVRLRKYSGSVGRSSPAARAHRLLGEPQRVGVRVDSPPGKRVGVKHGPCRRPARRLTSIGAGCLPRGRYSQAAHVPRPVEPRASGSPTASTSPCSAPMASREHTPRRDLHASARPAP